MPDHLRLRIRRYLTAQEFASDMEQLKAFHGTSVSDRLLESLEKHGLLRPKVRLRWPDPVARRMWLERHSNLGFLHEAVEPDGARWEATLRLQDSLLRANHRAIYGNVPHPFDDPEPAFVEFLQGPADQCFLPHRDRRVSIANDLYPELYASCNVQDYYSGWQVLVAAEVADMGFHIRLNMADPTVAEAAREALWQGRAPDGDVYELFEPARALRGFHKHQATLDALVYSEEEAKEALTRIVGNQSARFRLTKEQDSEYRDARAEAARCGLERYNVGTPEIIDVCTCLAERWTVWDRDGRPLIAKAYKIYLAAAVRLLQLSSTMTIEEIKEAVGQQDGWQEPILDVIWPDWAREQKRRLTQTLIGAVPTEGPGALSMEDITAFANFVEQEYQDAIFLRLQSFERHAFGDLDERMAGMSSHLQGMAVAVEHVVRAMGGTRKQLYLMFKELWHDQAVTKLLKGRNKLAEQVPPPSEWPAFKAKLESLRCSGPAGAVVADLVMAHRLRGDVHRQLPETDQIEIEKLFVVLLRAAAMTHAHVQRSETAAGAPLASPAKKGSFAGEGEILP